MPYSDYTLDKMKFREDQIILVKSLTEEEYDALQEEMKNIAITNTDDNENKKEG